MKHNINLYLDEFRPQVDLLSLKVVSYVWLFCLFIIAIFYGLAVSGVEEQTKTNRKLTQEVVLEREITSKVKQQALAHQHDMELQQQVDTQAKEIVIKRKLVNALSGKEQSTGESTVTGYAELMYDLSLHTNKHLWLTDVLYSTEQIVIKGVTTNPAALPAWVAQLSDSDYFTGKSLADMKISASDNTHYSLFEIATTANPAGDPFMDWFGNVNNAEPAK